MAKQKMVTGVSCGLHGQRARVIAQEGNTITYRWPCGYEKTETLEIGPRGMRKPMSASQLKFFAKYWADGVTYQCPRCKRKKR